MKTIEVFDPAMCCTTGVCGPSVDPALARFAGDVEWLSAHGGVVERFNLAQQPGVFAEREIVRETLRAKGESCLPLILADGKIVREGTYPGRAELAALAEVDARVLVHADGGRTGSGRRRGRVQLRALPGTSRRRCPRARALRRGDRAGGTDGAQGERDAGTAHPQSRRRTARQRNRQDSEHHHGFPAAHHGDGLNRLRLLARRGV